MSGVPPHRRSGRTPRPDASAGDRRSMHRATHQAAVRRRTSGRWESGATRAAPRPRSVLAARSTGAPTQRHGRAQPRDDRHDAVLPGVRAPGRRIDGAESPGSRIIAPLGLPTRSGRIEIVADGEDRSPVTVAGPRRIFTGFLRVHRWRAESTPRCRCASTPIRLRRSHKNSSVLVVLDKNAGGSTTR